MTIVTTSSTLPALDSPRIEELRLSERPHCRSAYHTILRAERHDVEQQANEDIVSTRVAGYILLEFHAQSDFFGGRAWASIATRVTSLPLGTLVVMNTVSSSMPGDCSVTNLSGCFEHALPRTSHPSRPSINVLENMTRVSMEVTSKDYRTSMGKVPLIVIAFDAQLLVFDSGSLENSEALRDMAKRDGDNGVVVRPCHILSESTTQGTDPTGISGDSTMTHYAAGNMALPEDFGFSHFTEAFKTPGGVYQVWNLLSLEPNLHLKFDESGLWFERTSQPTRYGVCVFYEPDERYIHRDFVGPKDHVDGTPMVVEFVSCYQGAPPPDPQLLALHATCTRVAHMSGAAKFLDQLQWDGERRMF